MSDLQINTETDRVISIKTEDKDFELAFIIEAQSYDELNWANDNNKSDKHSI